jgi:hypothetical protein
MATAVRRLYTAKKFSEGCSAKLLKTGRGTRHPMKHCLLDLVDIVNVLSTNPRNLRVRGRIELYSGEPTGTPLAIYQSQQGKDVTIVTVGPKASIISSDGQFTAPLQGAQWEVHEQMLGARMNGRYALIEVREAQWEGARPTTRRTPYATAGVNNG